MNSGLKPVPKFEQRCHAAVDGDVAVGRMQYARDNLQQRAFAGAVLADDAERLAALNLEADVIERRRSRGGTRHDSDRAIPSGARWGRSKSDSSWRHPGTRRSVAALNRIYWRKKGCQMESLLLVQGDRQPLLANLDAGNAVNSPQIGEANSLTLRFRLRRSTSRKPVVALLGNRSR